MDKFKLYKQSKKDVLLTQLEDITLSKIKLNKMLDLATHLGIIGTIALIVSAGFQLITILLMTYQLGILSIFEMSPPMCTLMCILTLVDILTGFFIYTDNKVYKRYDQVCRDKRKLEAELKVLGLEREARGRIKVLELKMGESELK